MIINNLKVQLTECLSGAEEVCIAVALVQEKPLEKLLDNIPKDARQRILVGIDLPTTIAALTLLKSRAERSSNISGRIYHKPNKTFHPKVYLIKRQSWIGFIGSANLTEGGLQGNIELSYKVTSEKDCNDLVQWFNSVFMDAYPINEYNIGQLMPVLNPIQKPPIIRKPIVLKKDNPDSLGGIDFSDRFFKKEHHWAFREELWLDNSLPANKEREEAENRFLELHDLIYPKFSQHGLRGLFPNSEGNIVSRHHQINANAPRKLNGMWLSYGKSRPLIKKYQGLFTDKDEKKLQTFIHHTRLQIRIELKSIGIWMLFGKENNGSIFDRDFFSKKMNETSYRQQFFSAITLLPAEYWISVNDVVKTCREFVSADELSDFCKKDDLEKYFIIGRDYDLTDVQMSESNLPTETLRVFQLLFPLYEMMKHRF